MIFDADLWRNVKSHVIDAIYPRVCPLCKEFLNQQQAISSLCYKCWDKLDFCGETVCVHCAEPIEALEGAGAKIPKNPVCVSCMNKPPLFDKARAAFFYNEEISSLILQFKYADRTDFADLMAGWMSMRIGDWLGEVDYIIPVPLHYFRLIGRRYNQAMVIAKRLADDYNMQDKLISDMLIRHRYTRTMKNMTRNQRYKNLRSSISLNKKWHGKLKGKSVLVLDDVYTGGATFSACAGALRKAGAAKIYVASIARVLRR